MACFIVPATEAIVTTIATKVLKHKEHNTAALKATAQNAEMESQAKIPFSRKLGWLSNLLWGGSALLAFEHVWHGEVVPWFPFLTATANAADTAEMLREMSTVGVSMSVLVTTVWGCMLLAANVIEKRTPPVQATAEQEA